MNNFDNTFGIECETLLENQYEQNSDQCQNQTTANEITETSIDDILFNLHEHVSFYAIHYLSPFESYSNKR